VFLLNSSNVIQYGIGIDKYKASTLNAAVYVYTADAGFYRFSDASLEYTNWMGFKSNTDTVGRLSTNWIRRYQDDNGDWALSFKMNLFEDENVIDCRASATDIRKVGFYFGKYGSNALFTNRVTEAKLVNGDFDNVNSFGSGDTVTVDVGAAEITKNGKVSNGLGDYSNNWSDMYLDVGSNTIYTQHSDWVTVGYEPTITMRYRKRWL